MKIEKAQIDDAKKLTELTIRSKSFWSYSAEQIEEWRDDLTISSEYIDQVNVYKLIEENELIGHYSYFELDQKTVKLDNMFLEPTLISTGRGKVLMNHFVQHVRDNGVEKIQLDSEPNAEAFYRKCGFKVIGQLESSIKNRFLPIMELEINAY